MFLQLWSSARTGGHRAAREPRRRKWAHRPGMDWLDERCLLSAHVVAHFDQGVQVPAGARRSAALVAVTIPGQQPAPSGGVGKAASPVLSHNPGASSSVTDGGAGSTINSLAGSTAAAVSSITQVSPSLFASALTTTVPPAAGALTSGPINGHSFRLEFRAGAGPIVRAVAAGEPRASSGVSPRGPGGRPAGQRGDRLANR